MTDIPTGQAAADLLKEARDRLAMCVIAEADDRREAQEDFRFIAGEQWPDDMRNLRQVERRPCLTINKLPAFVHQVINEQRMNRPAIKVHPVDSGADVEVAEVEQGMIRYIEYNSNADAAYDTAVAHATIGGRGFFRLITDYSDEESFDQEIKFKRVQNPFTVYFDPFSTEPDGSDARFCFISDILTRAEFKAQYPKAEANTAAALTVGAGDQALVWISEETVRVAEYYRVKTTPATLCRLEDGTSVWKDELPEGAVVVKERQSEKRVIEWFKITAADVLERTELVCSYIPVFPVYGDEQIVNGRIRRNGMVRFARDPQRMYNFWMTSATEEVSLRPKTPFIGAVGQFETGKKDWKSANQRSFAFLEYDPIEVNGVLAPPPQRSQMADVPTGVLAMAMHASDNIKATTGIFDASLGAQGNETSGRAINARQREGDTANFHFADNLARTIKHAGRCILQMIPRIYDTQRIVRVLGEDDKMDMVEVNAPNVEQKPTKEGAIHAVLNDLTTGRYDVTISTGPSFTSKRAEAAEGMMQLAQANPQVWMAGADIMVRNLDWPGADELSERFKKLLPPELQDEDEDAPPAAIPPQIQQVLQQAAQEIQQLQGALQEAQSGMAIKRIETESRERIAEAQEETKRQIATLNNETKHEVEELKGMVQLLVAKATPPPGMAEDVGEDFKTEAPQGASSVSGIPPEQMAELAQLIAATMAQNKPSGRRRMMVTAPSGAVYHGEVMDDDEQPQGEE